MIFASMIAISIARKSNAPSAASKKGINVEGLL
jgi:hypothetical protein